LLLAMLARTEEQLSTETGNEEKENKSAQPTRDEINPQLKKTKKT